MLTLVAACAFGLEAIVKRELIALGYEPKVSQPGRIQFRGSWIDICKTNIWLKTADRVLIQVQQFDSPDFEALFENVKGFDWSQFLPSDAEFPVTGRARLSQLSSVPAIQRSVKRAIVESLKRDHRTNVLPETGPLFRVDVALLNDVATLTIDTTGASLHKRGYRKLTGEAPIKETLAAALIDLSVWRSDRYLVDPFCGTGTIPIEAARIGMNIAPGLERDFACSNWNLIEKSNWEEVRDSARSGIRNDIELHISGTDINSESLDMARYHAKQAGVENQIHFQQKSFSDFRSKREYGVIVTNPPYGERLEDHERLKPLYASIPAVFQRVPTWSFFLISNMPALERIFQTTATRRRKLFNGRIECTYFQFLGPKPPRKLASSSDEAATMGPLSDRILENPGGIDSNAKTDQPKPAKVERSIPDAANSESSAESKDVPEVLVDRQQRASSTISAESTSAERVNPWKRKEIADVKRESTKTEQPPEAHIHAGEQKGEKNNSPVIQTFDKKASRNVDEQAPVFGGLTPKDHEQADLFRSRLQKRARHLRRWPTRRGITCFRVYEKDIPEIPLVVDRYEGNLHITEYERPHERDIARHAQWLELMKKTAAATLDIPIQKTHLKTRDRDQRQYEKLASNKKRIVVNEGGLKFLVNLTDYVDTGLFLDHRLTRDMVRNESDGKRFLNLFAYTGSFTVYAADGGAKTTTTVDLSKNYLDWARANMETNEHSGWQHQYVAQDIVEFLNSAIESDRRFDLCIVDPPTFSNSKRTDDDWDLQTRYAELLNLIAKIMSPSGVVYFSNNFRRFKFDEDLLDGYESIREISKQTVPEDFRNQRIHRCWRMVVGSRPSE